MALGKEEVGALVDRVLEGDQDAFEEFYRQYDKIICKFTIKWIPVIGKTSYGMYDFEDLHNEMWAEVYNRLHTYNHEMGQMSTWLYRVCPTIGDYINRYWSRAKRRPEDQDSMTSLDSYVSDDESTRLANFIMDPAASFQDDVCNEEMIYEYAYLVKLLVERLGKHKLRLAYMHQIKGLNLEASSAILGTSRERVRQQRIIILRMLNAIKAQCSKKKIDADEARSFALELLCSSSDDQVSLNTGYDLPTIKICREVLSIAEIYVK